MIYDQRLTKLNRQATTVLSGAGNSQRVAAAGVFVRAAVAGQPMWGKFGDSNVVATAGANGEFYIPVGVLDVPIPDAVTHLAVIQTAATSLGSLTVFS